MYQQLLPVLALCSCLVHRVVVDLTHHVVAILLSTASLCNFAEPVLALACVADILPNMRIFHRIIQGGLLDSLTPPMFPGTTFCLDDDGLIASAPAQRAAAAVLRHMFYDFWHKSIQPAFCRDTWKLCLILKTAGTAATQAACTVGSVLWWLPGDPMRLEPSKTVGLRCYTGAGFNGHNAACHERWPGNL